jgi:hypothetical protein
LSYLLFILLLFVLLFVLLVIYFLAFIFLVHLAVILNVGRCLLLPLHPSLSQLFHHLQKLLPIIFQKIVGDGEDTTWPCF